MRRLLHWKKRHLLILFFLLSVAGFKACDYGYLEDISDMEDYEYNAVFAFPLVNSSLNINDIIDMEGLGSIEVDEDKLISLVYRGRVFSIPASQLFVIPNQQQNSSITVNPVTRNQSVHEKIFLFAFEGDQTINWISFLQGLFSIRLEAPQLIADGYSISANFEILNSIGPDGNPLAGQVDGENTSVIDLEGSSIDFQDDSNIFMVRYVVTLSAGPGASPDNAPYTVNFFQSMTDLRYDLLEGFIGELSFPVGATGVDLGLFRNANLGNIFFQAPSFRLVSRNSFGAPAHLTFNAFNATNKEDEIVQVQNAEIQSFLSITSPSQPGETAQSIFLMNRDNTNIEEIMDIRPTEIFYDVSGTLNPGNTPSANFIKHNSSLTIDLEIDLPLFGRIDFFEIHDTLDLSFDNIPEELEWMELKLQMNNGFPLESQLQLSFTDNNYQVLEILFDTPSQENILEPAPVDPATGIVTQSTHKTSLIMISGDKLDAVRNATHVILQARLYTYNQQEGQLVKILEDYELGIKLGARAKASRTINLKPVE